MPGTWEHGGWGRPGFRFLPVGPPSPPCPQVGPGLGHSARGHRLGPSERGRKLAVLPAAESSDLSTAAPLPAAAGVVPAWGCRACWHLGL